MSQSGTDERIDSVRPNEPVHLNSKMENQNNIHISIIVQPQKFDRREPVIKPFRPKIANQYNRRIFPSTLQRMQNFLESYFLRRVGNYGTQTIINLDFIFRRPIGINQNIIRLHPLIRFYYHPTKMLSKRVQSIFALTLSKQITNNLYRLVKGGVRGEHSPLSALKETIAYQIKRQLVQVDGNQIQQYLVRNLSHYNSVFSPIHRHLFLEMKQLFALTWSQKDSESPEKRGGVLEYFSLSPHLLTPLIRGEQPAIEAPTHRHLFAKMEKSFAFTYSPKSSQSILHRIREIFLLPEKMGLLKTASQAIESNIIERIETHQFYRQSRFNSLNRIWNKHILSHITHNVEKITSFTQMSLQKFSSISQLFSGQRLTLFNGSNLTLFKMSEAISKIVLMYVSPKEQQTQSPRELYNQSMELTEEIPMIHRVIRKFSTAEEQYHDYSLSYVFTNRQQELVSMLKSYRQIEAKELVEQIEHQVQEESKRLTEQFSAQIPSSAEITNQVYNQLTRRLKFEKERLGF